MVGRGDADLLKARGVGEVDGVVPGVGVAVERLRVGEVVAAVVRVRLVEAGVPAVVAAEHRLVGAVRVALVDGESARLERLVSTSLPDEFLYLFFDSFIIAARLYPCFE